MFIVVFCVDMTRQDAQPTVTLRSGLFVMFGANANSVFLHVLGAADHGFFRADAASLRRTFATMGQLMIQAQQQQHLQQQQQQLQPSRTPLQSAQNPAVEKQQLP